VVRGTGHGGAPTLGVLAAARGPDGQQTAALDVQTGGGEVLAQIPHPPAVLAATESWPPNVEIARRNLAPLGATVVAVDDDADLPFPADSFDLVVSRHPVQTRWDEIARVLTPGGAFLSQMVGAGSVRELTDAMMARRRQAAGAVRAGRPTRPRLPAWW
jgi:SAM-dependent methyltransferase